MKYLDWTVARKYAHIYFSIFSSCTSHPLVLFLSLSISLAHFLWKKWFITYCWSLFDFFFLALCSIVCLWLMKYLCNKIIIDFLFVHLFSLLCIFMDGRKKKKSKIHRRRRRQRNIHMKRQRRWWCVAFGFLFISEKRIFSFQCFSVFSGDEWGLNCFMIFTTFSQLVSAIRLVRLSFKQFFSHVFDIWSQ